MTPALPWAAMAQCPTNTFTGCGTVSSSTAPVFSTGGSGYGCGYGGGSGGYDLTAGLVWLDAYGWSDGDAEVSITTEDIYQLTGPDSGEPIPLSAKFTVAPQFHIGGNRYGCMNGRAMGLIREGDSIRKVGFFTCCVCGIFSYSDVASLPLVHRVGEPFHLVMVLDADAGISSAVLLTGRLAFDPPPGYVVTSCQGFSTAPTPTRATSWGKLKTLYR